MYCKTCSKFLPDRFVKGVCPHCGEGARGDQCEACGSVLEPENLPEAKCSLCGEAPEFRPTNHLFLAVTRLKDELDSYLKSHSAWRKNAYELSKRYIKEGLRDRSLTRDLDWGIDVPMDGFDGKKYTSGQKMCLDTFQIAIHYAVNKGLISMSSGTVANNITYTARTTYLSIQLFFHRCF